VIGIIIVAAPLDEQVAGLHVAVHQSVPVRGVQGSRGLAEQEEGGGRHDPAPLLEHLAQVGP